MDSCKLSLQDLLLPPVAPASPIAVGLVGRHDFVAAQAAIPGLTACIDYDDWLDRREGLQIGLDMAGSPATIVRLDLASFLEWRRLTGATASEKALDTFAGLALGMRTRAISRVLASVDRADFVAHSRLLGPIAGGGDYARWLKHRRTLQVKLEALGERPIEVAVQLNDFFSWCSCLHQAASEETLDRYAYLTLERLTTLVSC